MQEYGQRIEFVQGLPQNKSVQDFIIDFPGQQKLIVLDDLMEKASNRADVAALFTHGRHENLSIMYLTQNFFHKSKYARDISLNIDYVVLFKNTRDPSMVTHLGQPTLAIESSAPNRPQAPALEALPEPLAES